MYSLFSYYENCTLCPRNCGVCRLSGNTGFCGETASLRAARAALHMWEEPCISGTKGSGTVFFSGCNLGCIFCQNEPISSGGIGKNLTVDDLCRIYLSLQDKGANNINLVTPTHFVPHIVTSLELARKNGLSIPIVYNTGSYEKIETLRMLDGLIDVYLPDLKFYNPTVSREYCHAGDYYEVARAAIEEMFRQTGPCQFAPEKSGDEFNPTGPRQFAPETNENEPIQMMTRGVMVRHLLLPGLEEDAYLMIKQLYKTYGNSIYLSIMSQYTPMPRMADHETLAKPVNYGVYDRLIDRLIDLGVENAFIQEEGVNKESFIPLFDYEGL